ncbi:hypothetical protein ACFXTO_031389 [Malus domestica]
MGLAKIILSLVLVLLDDHSWPFLVISDHTLLLTFRFNPLSNMFHNQFSHKIYQTEAGSEGIMILLESRPKDGRRWLEIVMKVSAYLGLFESMPDSSMQSSDLCP